MNTELQQKIIGSSASAKLMVKAGPGTGKTFCLIERLKYLVREERLEAATEILVLSFSVAAAREIRSRLQAAVVEQGYDGELLEVTIRTFDSFASYFMFRLDQDIDLSGCEYDRRIAMATEIISSREDARQWLGRYRHIMIDEVQDLVGLRASLTLAVLNAGGGGFTLFGDPAQAVYNFLMGANEAGPTSDEFLAQVYRYNHGKINDYFLSENFRVGENARLKALADSGRCHLLESPPQVAYNFLRRTFADLTPLGSLNDIIVPDHLQNSDTAFLCRTNGQLLILARHFRHQTVNFTIRRPLEGKDIPAWAGRIFTAWQNQDVKKKDFLAAMSAITSPGIPAPQQAWQALKTAARVKSGSIKVTLLRQTLLEEDISGYVDSEEHDNSAICLATVHRAKGCEFSNVVLTIPEQTDPAQFLDEGRVIFVGLTRARNHLYKMSEKGAKGIRKMGERWLQTTTSNGRQRLIGIELGCPGDIDIHSPVALSMFTDGLEEIEENQEILWEDVRHGSPARLELYRISGGVPIYYVMASDGDDYLAVALTSKNFGFNLKNIVTEMQGGQPSFYPGVIEDLWVRKVVTEVGNLGNEDVPLKYRSTGLWLGVRLQGLGTCRDWRKLP